MDIKELLNYKISLYYRVDSVKSLRTITIKQWLVDISNASKDTINKIREVNSTDPKTAKILKQKNLPCATISGVFYHNRKIEEIDESTPIICIDIDDLPVGMTIDELKDRLISLPYVFYVGVSARGEGVYALVYYNINNNFNHTFKSLQQDFDSMGITIDPACSDVSRLRFASWDSNPRLRKGDIEMYDKVVEPTPKEFQNIDYRWSSFVGLPVVKNDDIDFQLVKKIVYALVDSGYQTNTYNDWLLDGFRLATMGEEGYQPFLYLSQHSDNFNEQSFDQQWKRCLRYTNMDKESLLYFYGEIKRKLGPGWKKKLN